MARHRVGLDHWMVYGLQWIIGCLRQLLHGVCYTIGGLWVGAWVGWEVRAPNDVHLDRRSSSGMSQGLCWIVGSLMDVGLDQWKSRVCVLQSGLLFVVFFLHHSSSSESSACLSFLPFLFLCFHLDDWCRIRPSTNPKILVLIRFDRAA